MEVFRWISRADLIQQWEGGLSEVSLISTASNGGGLGERFHLDPVRQGKNGRTAMEMTVTEYILASEKFGVQIRTLGNPGEGFIENG